MKALYFYEHGTFENLYYGEVEDPVAGDGEVVVKVRAAAMNHLDLWVLQGWPGLRIELPHIGGADVAGEIVDIGHGVSGWSVGDRVVINPGISTADDEYTRRGEESLSPGYQILGEQLRGGFAEYVKVPAKNLYRMQGEKFESACAPLLVGLTAWRMLKRRAQLCEGETVAIVGAGGGVNSFSIVLAKALGAKVVALTSTAEKAQKARDLGADHVVDYRKTPDWSREVRRITGNRGADVVVDNVGAATFQQSLAAASRGGRIVTVGNTSGPHVSFDNRLVFAKQLSLLGSTMGSAEDFKDLQSFLLQQQIKSVIDRVIPLKDGKKGYEALRDGVMFGKVILVP